MVGQRGKPPGYPKSGGIKKGGVKTNTKAVKDAIREVFFDDLGGKDYLRKIAKKDESLFVSLLAKLIPTELRAELDVRHHSINLGAMMAEADARLSLNHDAPTVAPFQENPHAYIDVTPAKVVADEDE